MSIINGRAKPLCVLSAGVWMAAGASVLGLGGEAEAFERTRIEGDGTPIEWPDRCVRWRLNERGSAAIPFDDLLTSLQNAFAVWQDEDCSDVAFLYEGTTSSESVGYSNSGGNSNIIVFHDAPGSWPHEGAVIALATVTFCLETRGACQFKGAILDADIEFNGEQFPFTVTERLVRPTFDVWNTAAHEIGHVIGLDHTPESDATMFATAEARERLKRDLHQDDIDGLCAVYPTPVGSNGDACFGKEPGDEPDNPPEQASGSCEQSGGTGSALLALISVLGLCRRRRR
ncbi:MAG: matrixin family metalloprotease [Bradymonadia bacterium]